MFVWPLFSHSATHLRVHFPRGKCFYHILVQQIVMIVHHLRKLLPMSKGPHILYFNYGLLIKSSVVFFGIFKTAIIQKVNISTNDLVMIFQMQKDEDPTLFLSRSRQPYVSQARPRIKKSTSTFFTFPFFQSAYTGRYVKDVSSFTWLNFVKFLTINNDPHKI